MLRIRDVLSRILTFIHLRSRIRDPEKTYSEYRCQKGTGTATLSHTWQFKRRTYSRKSGEINVQWTARQALYKVVHKKASAADLLSVPIRLFTLTILDFPHFVHGTIRLTISWYLTCRIRIYFIWMWFGPEKIMRTPGTCRSGSADEEDTSFSEVSGTMQYYTFTAILSTVASRKYVY